MRENKGTYDANYYQKNKDSYKESIQKYQKRLKSISVRVKPELYDDIKSYVEEANIPLRQFVIDALLEKIERDKK